MPLVLVTAPAEHPVSLNEVKEHLRVDFTDHDTLISSLIEAATGHLEKRCRRAFVTQEWRLELAAFAAEIEIPLPPLVSVDQIDYTDAAGSQQTLPASVYNVDTASTPGRVVRADGADWPETKMVPGAVRIAFTAGFGGAADVPGDIKAAIKLMVGHWYENREAVIVGQAASELPMAVDALIAPYRVHYI
jgi:uncharacterized phiE125 gp8 family phage protein